MRETLAPGAVAQVVADRHGIGTGLLYTWRKQMLRAAMTGFAAVEIRPEALPAPQVTNDRAAPVVEVPPVPSTAPSTVAAGGAVGGLIEVEFADRGAAAGRGGRERPGSAARAGGA